MASDFTGPCGAIIPLFDWLKRLGVITHDQELEYQRRKPHVFFESLRDGYLLSKIAMVAVPEHAHYFRNDVCPRAVLR